MMSKNDVNSAVLNDNIIEKTDRKPYKMQAVIGWNTADYDIRNTREGKSIIHHGKEIYGASTGIESKYVRAFIFEGMISGPKGDNIAIMIQERCTTYWVWDHAKITIRKIDRPDERANYRIEILHVDMNRLKQFSQILKAAGFVEKVFEEYPQKENVLA